MSRSHINSDVNTSNAHAYKSLPLKNLTIDSNENTTFLAHYDVSPNDVSGIRPYGAYVDDNVLLYYDMSSLFTNASGTFLVDRGKYSSHGKVIGATLVNGRIGKALGFNGASRVESMIDPSKINSLAFAIEAWVYPTTTTGSWMIYGKQEPNQRIYCGNNANGVWDIGINTSAWGADVTGTRPTVDVNTWQHIVLVLDNGVAKLYKNGVFACSKTYTSFTSTMPFYVGAHNSAGTPQYYFPGRIHNFIASNRILSDAEIAQRYNEPIYTMSKMGFGKYGGAIAIEEATENLHSSTFTPGGTWSGTLTVENVTSPEFKWYKRIRSVSATPYNTVNIPCKPNTAYALSIYIRKVRLSPSGYIQLYVRENGGANALLRINESDLDYTFKRFTVTKITSETATYIERASLQFLSFAAEDIIEIADWQLEERNFATSFVDGAREKGRLVYTPTLINPTAFTINFWVKMNKTVVGINEFFFSLDYPNTNYIFQIGKYYTNEGFFIHWDGGGAGNSTPLPVNTWMMLTVTYSSTNGWRLYRDGQFIQADPRTPVLNISSDSTISIGHHKNSISNILIDELRIDNVARTDDEILAWYTCNTPFAPQGDERLVY